MAQKPEATQVAGYTLWQQLGRQVDKGQRGISIIAPVTRKIEAEGPAAEHAASAVEQAAAGSPRRGVVGFRAAYVWDVPDVW